MCKKLHIIFAHGKELFFLRTRNLTNSSLLKIDVDKAEESQMI